jgi:S-phase kinase-associated protein 1
MADQGHKVILLAGDPDHEWSDDALRVIVSREAACMSELIQSMLADDEEPNETPEIPLLEVSKDLLDKVAAFMEYHCHDPMREIPKPITTSNLGDMVSEWDVKFIDLEQEELYRVMLAANYLHIPSLLDLAVTKFCCLIKGKSVDEVQEFLRIESKPSPEEEQMIRQKNQWIFDVRRPE